MCNHSILLFFVGLSDLNFSFTLDVCIILTIHIIDFHTKINLNNNINNLTCSKLQKNLDILKMNYYKNKMKIKIMNISRIWLKTKCFKLHKWSIVIEYNFGCWRKNWKMKQSWSWLVMISASLFIEYYTSENIQYKLSQTTKYYINRKIIVYPIPIVAPLLKNI